MRGPGIPPIPTSAHGPTHGASSSEDSSDDDDASSSDGLHSDKGRSGKRHRHDVIHPLIHMDSPSSSGLETDTSSEPGAYPNGESYPPQDDASSLPAAANGVGGASHLANSSSLSSPAPRAAAQLTALPNGSASHVQPSANHAFQSGARGLPQMPASAPSSQAAGPSQRSAALSTSTASAPSRFRPTDEVQIPGLSDAPQPEGAAGISSTPTAQHLAPRSQAHDASAATVSGQPAWYAELGIPPGGWAGIPLEGFTRSPPSQPASSGPAGPSTAAAGMTPQDRISSAAPAAAVGRHSGASETGDRKRSAASAGLPDGLSPASVKAGRVEAPASQVRALRSCRRDSPYIVVHSCYAITILLVPACSCHCV